LTEASSERPPASANFINPETVHPPFGYSHVVEVTAGRPVYIAGQVALDPAGTLVGADDIRAQPQQAEPQDAPDHPRIDLGAGGRRFKSGRPDQRTWWDGDLGVASGGPR
jgi:hypothetical protein